MQEPDIPLYSRIISIVDVYDALANKRVYRKKVFAPKEVLDIIKEDKGTQFDPKLVQELLSNCYDILQLENREI